MKSAIEKIFYGETNSQDMRVTEEYHRLSEKGSKIYGELYAALNDGQKEQLEEIYSCLSGQESKPYYNTLKRGSSLGLRLPPKRFWVNFC